MTAWMLIDKLIPYITANEFMQEHGAGTVTEDRLDEAVSDRDTRNLFGDKPFSFVIDKEGIRQINTDAYESKSIPDIRQMLDLGIGSDDENNSGMYEDAFIKIREHSRMHLIGSKKKQGTFELIKRFDESQDAVVCMLNEEDSIRFSDILEQV